MHTTHRTLPPSRPSARAHLSPLSALALGSVLLMAGCGGGGDTTTAVQPLPPVGATTALAYTQGTVEGLGSVVVNGVRFDERQATITNDQGQGLAPAELKLGMRLEVLAPPAQTGPDGVATATAQAVRVGSELQGPVSALLPDGMVVLGHTVRYNVRTLFDDGRAAALRVGQVVEIHGQRDAQGVVQATRVDTEDDPREAYKAVGTITAVDAQTRTAVLDGVAFSYGAVPDAATPVVGQRWRVEFQAAPVGASPWQATALRAVQPLAATGSTSIGTAPVLNEGTEADVEGFITQVAGATRFAVAGVWVDASAAGAALGQWSVGDAVEVEGRWRDGALVAQRIERETNPDHDDTGFEIEGRVTNLDTAARTLVLRGMTVDWSRARFEDGNAAQLAVGQWLDIQGPLSADGQQVLATEIEFD